jgi:hypothetical protein
MLTSTIVMMASAESVNILKSQMTDDEKGVCGTFVITDLWSIPVRVEMEYKKLPNDNSLIIKTQSDLKFERGSERFIMITETIDRHDLTLMLDYKQPTNQEIYYRVYSNSDIVQEGTWLQQDVPVFCMKFHFLAQEAPPVYDAQYFEEKYDEVHGNRLSTIITNQDEAEAFNTIMGMLGMFSTLIAGVLAVVIIIKFNDVKRALQIPTDALLKAVKSFLNSENNVDEATKHFVVKTNDAIDKINDEAHKLETVTEKTLRIASTVKPTVKVDEVTIDEVLAEPEKPKTVIPSVPKKIGESVLKGANIIKDQFIESKKDDTDLEKLSVEDRKKAIYDSYKIKTRDELCEITHSIYKKLQDKSATRTDRLSYDIAQELIQKK